MTMNLKAAGIAVGIFATAWIVTLTGFVASDANGADTTTATVVQVDDRPTPDRWRARVCNAKDRGAKPHEIVDHIVEQYGTTRESTRSYVRAVYGTCNPDH